MCPRSTTSRTPLVVPAVPDNTKPKSSWKAMVHEKMQENGDRPENVVRIDTVEGGMDLQFEHDTGEVMGPAFTMWTRDFVYFPVATNHDQGPDIQESVGYVPRKPGATPHHSQHWGKN